MEAEELGHQAIAQAIGTEPAILIEMTRQFGDVLHSTLAVRHYRATQQTRVVWAISDAYADAFSNFVPEVLGPHAIARLPALPAFPGDAPARIAWVSRAAQMPGVRAIGCGVHPWGWKRGDIVSAILENAKIANLAVPRRPWIPLDLGDIAWADDFVQRNGLQGGFFALEYTSHSLGSRDPGWFADLARRLPLPTVSLGAASDPHVPSTIDGRGTTFRQAKALITRASCFVGCGSGLSVMATSDGCEQPMVEFCDPALAATGIGYRQRSGRNAVLSWTSPDAVSVIRGMLASHRPPRPSRRPDPRLARFRRKAR